MRTSVALFTTLSLLLLGGCATAKAQRSLVADRMESYVIPKPPDAVWPHVRELLKAKGYDVPAQSEMNQVESSQKSDGSRYIVSVARTEAASSIVTFMLARNAGEGLTQKRDTELLWELVKRVDPEGAKQVEAEAYTLARQ